jgi:hypothetical protein
VNSLALVSLTRMTNRSWQQMTVQGGQASFDVSPGRYTVQVSAGGYEKAVEDIDVIGIGGANRFYRNEAGSGEGPSGWNGARAAGIGAESAERAGQGTGSAARG